MSSVSNKIEGDRSMICASCSKRFQPDWKFCPECGREIVISSDEILSSGGVKYFPEAFEAESYRFGKMIAETTSFYQVFLRFVLCVVSDITQLVHFRAQVIHEANLIAGSKHNLSPTHVLWCALSVASDRYFSEKALLYDWKATDEQQISSGWYDLIAPAFVPNSPNRKMEAKLIRDWVAQFLALHRRASGPLPTCGA